MKSIEIAKKYIGLQEVRDNKQLSALLKSQAIRGDIAIDPAKVAWCAGFVNFCEREAGNKGNGNLMARSFESYGQEIDWDDAQEGDIITFHFPNQPKENGHVAFFVRWYDDNNTVTVLGGNQNNKVCYNNYNQDDITAIRRPPLCP